MELTWPQIIMLNHAVAVNNERSDRRYKAKEKKGNTKPKGTPLPNNQSWKDLTPEEQAAETDRLMGQF